MTPLANLFVGLLAAATISSVAARSRPGVRVYDEITGLPQCNPRTKWERLYFEFKPFLKVFDGCVPFPAVDLDGWTGGGINSHVIRENKNCSSSPGQVYARGARHKGKYAIMYSWYFPRDNPCNGRFHPHDWQNIIVWLAAKDINARIDAVALSANDSYDIIRHGDFGFRTVARRPLIGYQSYSPSRYPLIMTDKLGAEQPLATYENMSRCVRRALQNHDFGWAKVPFKDGMF